MAIPEISLNRAAAPYALTAMAVLVGTCATAYKVSTPYVRLPAIYVALSAIIFSVGIGITYQLSLRLSRQRGQQPGKTFKSCMISVVMFTGYGCVGLAFLAKLAFDVWNVMQCEQRFRITERMKEEMLRQGVLIN